MQAYIALIRKEDGTSYGVEFPDFPGCITAGETLDEALRRAPEALALHIGGMEEDGDDIPAPSALDRVIANPENRDAVAVMVHGPTQKGKVVRINVTFDEFLLQRIDRAAAADGVGRSGWLATMARQRLEAAPMMGAPDPDARAAAILRAKAGKSKKTRRFGNITINSPPRKEGRTKGAHKERT